MLENRTADIDKPVKRRMRAPSVKGKEVKSPLRYRVSFLIWMLILITPVGVFLWLAYFRRPHISIKLIISVIWLFWWVIFTIALVMTLTGNAPSNT